MVITGRLRNVTSFPYDTWFCTSSVHKNKIGFFEINGFFLFFYLLITFYIKIQIVQNIVNIYCLV